MDANRGLIVGVECQPTDQQHPIDSAENQVLKLACQLKGLPVILKVEAILRACGTRLIRHLHDLDFSVMADYKLSGIPSAMELEAKFLRQEAPELVTVMANTGLDSMKALVTGLVNSNTEVLAVMTLTSFGVLDCHEIYNHGNIEEVTAKLAHLASEAGVREVVCSPHELHCIRPLELLGNTPNIRPDWTDVRGDDQSNGRVATPAIAMELGAHRIIVSRPITQSKDPRQAVEKILSEINLVS